MNLHKFRYVCRSISFGFPGGQRRVAGVRYRGLSVLLRLVSPMNFHNFLTPQCQCQVSGARYTEGQRSPLQAKIPEWLYARAKWDRAPEKFLAAQGSDAILLASVK